jgi:hypothetical protein
MAKSNDRSLTTNRSAILEITEVVAAVDPVVGEKVTG